MSLQPTMQIRVQKRITFNSAGTHCNYVVQQFFQDGQGGGEWRDVPVVDERCEAATYE